MNSFRVEKYSEKYKNQWDNFIRNSKNGTFLFERNFMEYHKDRFEDFSLLIFEKNKLLAVFPANKNKEIIFSHQGLTYGGIVFPKKIKFEKSLEVLKTLLSYLERNNFKKLILKLLPKIYHTYPADEIDYLLFILQAKSIRTDLSSSILQAEALKIQSNRVEGVKKAKKQGLEIEKTTDFQGFWEDVLIPNLAKQHQAKPVHNYKEISYLAAKFPKNIHQYNVKKENNIVGGCTVFETEKVAHIQYISADKNKQKLGTLDFLFQHLIEKEFKEKTYFDFGISNENQGLNLNKGLLYWKECFGARGIAYQTYEIQIKNHKLLENIFL